MARKGYYIKARKIGDSEIAHCAPVVREIWDFLLREVNYTDNERNGIKRGQIFVTYDEISEHLHWFVGYRKMRYTKTQCEKAMKTLTKMHMTTLTKTTRGMLITVCKYDTYQDPKTYEDATEDGKKILRRRKGDDTILKEGKESKEGEIVIGEKISPTPPADLDALILGKQKELYDSLVPFVEEYGKEMLKAFYRHWGEPTKSRKKIRWELERTWDLKLRLAKWQSNEYAYGKKQLPGTGTEYQPNAGLKKL